MRTRMLSLLLVAALTLAACMPVMPEDTTMDAAPTEAPAEAAPAARVFPLPEPDYVGKRARNWYAFTDALATFTPERAAELDAVLTTATIPQIQELFAGGELTSVELVTYYVNRIRRYDIGELNAVMELNPNALVEAVAADELRASGTVIGAMHGIPVLLKDNIATGDGMRTTAGAYVLKDWQPDRDAFLVAQLRAAGAIILGKANLSEWANYMDPSMPSGFSVVGGQTRHPYGPFDPLGSSSGSAVAAAANLATVTIGSETSGSITAPSQSNSVVGLKPTWGLVSGDYIIPLVDWLDTAGPIGRNVIDVAILLTAMTGVDASAAADADLQAAQELDYAEFAATEAAQGLVVALPIYDDEASMEATLALFKSLGMATDDAMEATLRQQMAAQTERNRGLAELMTGVGLKVVEVSSSAIPPNAVLPVMPILEYGFGDSLSRFAATAGGDFPIASVADVVAFNNENLANRAPYGQALLEMTANTALTAEEYAALRTTTQGAVAAALDAVLAEAGAAVILIDDSMISYPVAGYPSLTLPIGYAPDGQPVGLRFVAGYLGEPELIAVAYAIEQAAQARVAPNLEATLSTFADLQMAVPSEE